jgi:hypothetical protein
MRHLFYIAALGFFGLVSAQNENQPVATPNKDTTSVNRQLQKEADMKTMDAVKTQDHEKPVLKPKNASKKDTTKVKKRARR